MPAVAEHWKRSRSIESAARPAPQKLSRRSAVGRRPAALRGEEPKDIQTRKRGMKLKVGDKADKAKVASLRH